MTKADRVTGCWTCGKPALLVGDVIPTEYPLCFWCMAEARPGAAALFLPKLAAVGPLACDVGYRLTKFARFLVEVHIGVFFRPLVEEAEMVEENPHA